MGLGGGEGCVAVLAQCICANQMKRDKVCQGKGADGARNKAKRQKVECTASFATGGRIDVDLSHGDASSKGVMLIWEAHDRISKKLGAPTGCIRLLCGTRCLEE